MWSKLLLVTVMGVLVSSASVLADAANGGNQVDPVLPPWAVTTSVITAILGGPIFGLWYAWFLTTKRIPLMEKRQTEMILELERRHEAHNELMANNFRVDLAQVLKNAREDMSTMWLTKREDDNKLIAAIQRLGEQMDQAGCKFESSRAS